VAPGSRPARQLGPAAGDSPVARRLNGGPAPWYKQAMTSSPDLAEVLVHNSAPTVEWLRDCGIRFLPNYGRQAYNVDGRFKFFGGVVLRSDSSFAISRSRSRCLILAWNRPASRWAPRSPRRAE